MNLKLLLIILIVANNSWAMDRWTALALVETGGNDRMIGRAGEISRYQIRPELWAGGNPRDLQEALIQAQRIMARRITSFEKSHGRVPNDLEFYVLWNAPAQVNRPHRVVVERARRFVNLVALRMRGSNL